MDRAEYRELMNQIKAHDANGRYSEAADLIEEINWKRVKSASTLCSVAAILGRAGRYDEEKELLLMAYDRASIGRSILFELTQNALRSEDLAGAKKYYNEYIETAPKDSKRYILQYRIGQAEGKTARELIPCLEELHERAFSEEWGYELAMLYDACGEEDKCVQICDEIAIYFGEGEYVDKALDLKQKYKELSSAQRRSRQAYRVGQNFAAGAELAADAAAEEKFSTKDLQRELAASLQQLQNAQNSVSVEQTMHSVRKLVDDSALPIEAPEPEPIPVETPAPAADQDIMPAAESGPAQEEEKPDGGYRKIEDILADWEITREEAKKTLEEAEKKRLASAKASAVEQTQNIMDQIEGLTGVEQPAVSEPAAAAPQTESVQSQSAQPKPVQSGPEQSQPVRSLADDTREIMTAEPQPVPARSADAFSLTDEQKKHFTYFMSIQGMEEQISSALSALRTSMAGITSATGNVMIIGDKGCGKTMMANKLAKETQKLYPRPGARVGKINAGSLNAKDAATVLGKVRGGYLILEDVGRLTIQKAQELSDLMDTDTGGLLVIIEGTADEIAELQHNGTDLGSKFTVKINIPVMTSDELVEFAKVYADEKNASIDDMGILALYTKISAISKANHTTSLEEVREIMDGAIQKAIRKNLSNTMRSIFSSRYDDENHVILVEKDFE